MSPILLISIGLFSNPSHQNSVLRNCERFDDIFQPARDVPGTSREGPLKVLTSGTSRGPSGDSQGTNTKIDDLMKELFF